MTKGPLDLTSQSTKQAIRFELII